MGDGQTKFSFHLTLRVAGGGGAGGGEVGRGGTTDWKPSDRRRCGSSGIAPGRDERGAGVCAGRPGSEVGDRWPLKPIGWSPSERRRCGSPGSTRGPAPGVRARSRFPFWGGGASRRGGGCCWG